MASAESLRNRMLAAGAVLEGAHLAPPHYGDPRAELKAALATCALLLRDDLGRVLARGGDVLDLLHRLSTGDVRDLGPGDGTSTVLTTPKGRIVDRLFVQHLGEAGVLLVTSAGAAPRVIAHLDRYTFSESTGLEDVTATTRQLCVSGPLAAAAWEAAEFERPGPLLARVRMLEDTPLWLLGHDGWSADGLSVVCPEAVGGEVWESLVHAVAQSNGRPAGTQAMHAYRILRGFPAGGSELDEQHNPLEAGLEQSVSFDKGCYVGQEVVARLRTYDKISRALAGLELPAGSDVPLPGTRLFAGSHEAGEVTSSTLPPGWDHPVGLAYVRRKHTSAGDAVSVGAPGSGATARIVDLPFDYGSSNQE